MDINRYPCPFCDHGYLTATWKLVIDDTDEYPLKECDTCNAFALEPPVAESLLLDARTNDDQPTD